MRRPRSDNVDRLRTLGVDRILGVNGDISIEDLADAISDWGNEDWDEAYDDGFTDGVSETEIASYDEGFQDGVNSMVQDAYGSYPGK